MDIDGNQPGRKPPRSLLMDDARWPQNSPLSPTEVNLAQQHTILSINRFMAHHALPQAYRQLFPGLIIPLAAWLLRHQRNLGAPVLVGIGGAQGSGKSTLALALHLMLQDGFAARTCVLSLDNFYLDRSRRQDLAARIHPLLATRGVPGTHDIPLLRETLDRLLEPGDREVALPTFDKGNDERMPQAHWPSVSSRPELILLEGWCLGARAQSDAELSRPVNELEEKEDQNGTWRNFVNQQLRETYEPLFDLLSPQVFLKAPNWQAVYRWRANQERKLMKVRGKEYQGRLGDDDRLRRFISHYQRLTEAMMAQLPQRADVILTLNSEQQFSNLELNTPGLH